MEGVESWEEHGFQLTTEKTDNLQYQNFSWTHCRTEYAVPPTSLSSWERWAPPRTNRMWASFLCGSGRKAGPPYKLQEEIQIKNIFLIKGEVYIFKDF